MHDAGANGTRRGRLISVLIGSGHQTRERDQEHRGFRAHDQLVTQRVESTGQIRMRVIEDFRGVGAERIEHYDVWSEIFERRDGCHELVPSARRQPMTRMALSRWHIANLIP